MNSLRCWFHLALMASLLGVLLVGPIGCSDDGTADAPGISIEPSAITWPAIGIGDDPLARVVTIRSTGNSDLVVSSVAITAGAEWFTIVDELPSEIRLAPGDAQAFQVSAERTALGAMNGNLRVASNAVDGTQNVPLSAPDLAGTLVASPNPLSFGRVQRDTSRTRTLTVQNAGNRTLTITRLNFNTRPEIAMAGEGDAVSDNMLPELPLTLEATQAFDLDFICTPTTDVELRAELRIETDTDTTLTVDVTCNGPAPCLEVRDVTGRVNEVAIDFGSVAIGVDNSRVITVNNCARSTGEELEVTSITLDGDPAISLGNVDGRLPMQLVPGEQDTFSLLCNPSELEVFSSNLVFRSNDEEQDPLEIPVVCLGSDNNPPIADAKCRVTTPGSQTGFQEDLSTRAFQTVECTCADSSDPDGDAIVQCDWEISAPGGAVNSASGTPTNNHSFFLTGVGGWQACVTVTDDRGAVSNEPACVDIDAFEESEILCRLTWEHQFDGRTDPIVPFAAPNSSTGCGADLDIHALPSTEGSWFDRTTAVYYRQEARSREWPGAGTGSLDMDVRLGIGPEIITIQDPVPGVTYTCAVHYYDDYGWAQYPDAGGWTDATMEVFVSGLVVAEFTRRMTQTSEFWEAASITWRDGLPGDDDITSGGLNASHCQTSRAPTPCSPMPPHGGTSQPPCW